MSTPYTLAVIGEGGVGKSCLTTQFLSRTFAPEYDPTVGTQDLLQGDCYQKEITFEDQQIQLNILDTAGQDDYVRILIHLHHDPGSSRTCPLGSFATAYFKFGMLESILTQAQGYLIVYSITSKVTLERTPEFIDLVKRVNDGELPPTILVGNKCDLEITREITKAEGKAFADKMQLEWAEASAKNRINSDDIFYSVLRRVIERSKQLATVGTKSSRRSRCTIL